MSIQIILQPADYVAAENERFAFTINAYSSNESLSYLVQWRTIGRENWVNGSIRTTYWNSLATKERMSREYRWQITGSGGTEIYSRIFHIYNKSQTLSIVLQQNNSEPITVDKELTEIATFPGTLREQTSIIDPTFIVEANIATLTGCNYLTVESFGRSYFVNNIESISNGLVAISCHVDVLSSFKDAIRANSGIVRRAEDNTAFNLYINDNSLVAYQDPYILTEPFPNGFTGTAFILAVAGA